MNPQTEQLTFWQADSLDPANPLVLPGSEGARKMTVTSGRKCLELYKSLGPLGSLVKMLLTSSTWSSNARYLTWRVLGTTEGRLFYQLARSGRSIPEKGRSLLPTPIASCGRHLRFTQSQVKKVKIKNQRNGNHFSLSIVELITLNFAKRTNPCFVEMMMGFPENWTKID